MHWTILTAPSKHHNSSKTKQSRNTFILCKPVQVHRVGCQKKACTRGAASLHKWGSKPAQGGGQQANTSGGSTPAQGGQQACTKGAAGQHKWGSKPH